jgi:hypothetical protein
LGIEREAVIRAIDEYVDASLPQRKRSAPTPIQKASAQRRATAPAKKR